MQHLWYTIIAPSVDTTKPEQEESILYAADTMKQNIKQMQLGHSDSHKKQMQH